MTKIIKVIIYAQVIFLTMKYCNKVVIVNGILFAQGTLRENTKKRQACMTTLTLKVSLYSPLWGGTSSFQSRTVIQFSALGGP